MEPLEEGAELQEILRLVRRGRVAGPPPEGDGPLHREVALSCLDDCSVRHHSRVAKRTGPALKGHLSLASDDVLEPGERPIRGNWSPRGLEPLRVSHVLEGDVRAATSRSIKDDLTGSDPIGLGL